MDPRVNLHKFAEWIQDNEIKSDGDGRWNVPSSPVRFYEYSNDKRLYTTYNIDQLVQKYLKEKE